MTIMTDKERRLRLQLAESCAAEAFSGNVLIAAEGEVVYEGVLGYADRATGRRLTPHTMFNAASVAKTFTSAAVLLLHERGLLPLDSPQALSRNMPASEEQPATNAVAGCLPS